MSRRIIGAFLPRPSGEVAMPAQHSSFRWFAFVGGGVPLARRLIQRAVSRRVGRRPALYKRHSFYFSGRPEAVPCTLSSDRIINCPLSIVNCQLSIIHQPFKLSLYCRSMVSSSARLLMRFTCARSVDAPRMPERYHATCLRISMTARPPRHSTSRRA